MHTDEYEISIARELNHHRHVVKKIRAALDARQRAHGMDYAAAREAVAAGRLALAPSELAAWQEDVEALPLWEQRLEEYRQALEMMRISASRG